MTHIQHHVSPTDFKNILDIEGESHESPVIFTARSIRDFAGSIRRNYYESALEGTPGMNAQELWTIGWEQLARQQMNVNFIKVDHGNIAQHVLYLPLDIFRQISDTQAAFEISLDSTHQVLSLSDDTIASVLSDKANMFLYRTSLWNWRKLQDSVNQILMKLWEEVDIPDSLFFEWLFTDPNSIKPRKPWISVEWYVKDHRIDVTWSFQRWIRESGSHVWALIESAYDDNRTLWDWQARFNFKDPDYYHHILPN